MTDCIENEFLILVSTFLVRQKKMNPYCFSSDAILELLGELRADFRPSRPPAPQSLR